MAASARVSLGRAAEKMMNKTMSGNHDGNVLTQLLTNNTTGDGSKAKIIASLMFAKSQSVRTSTIILASFNILAAFATAVSILYDCYWSPKRSNSKYKAS